MGLLAGENLWPALIFTAIFLLLLYLMHRRKFWTSHYPPGPMPLPGLGNLLQLDFENMPYTMSKLQQRYGDVFSLQMAWRPVVMVNGLKAVREVLVTCGEDTSDRPLLPIYDHMGYGPKSNGKELKKGPSRQTRV
ncbi:cytochrome P450 2D26-like [Meriones unguiculatus]|uniref:cytochrome P450 2D26-like n=1 Tax=Meriones unguiculatus TaxID=10047 RepID=UPI00293EBB7F|nr:cytochrome P450 2D26-like [Meriones unguiculatus]